MRVPWRSAARSQVTGSSLLSEAIVLWVPVIDGRPHPSKEDALVDRYGTELALDLIPVVRALVDEFNSSDAGLTAPYDEIHVQAAATFRAAHPEISEAAIRRMANSYSFNFR